jgi:hypothetical protein
MLIYEYLAYNDPEGMRKIAIEGLEECLRYFNLQTLASFPELLREPDTEKPLSETVVDLLDWSLVKAGVWSIHEATNLTSLPYLFCLKYLRRVQASREKPYRLRRNLELWIENGKIRKSSID